MYKNKSTYTGISGELSGMDYLNLSKSYCIPREFSLMEANLSLAESKCIAIFIFWVFLVINPVLCFYFVLTDANETDGDERTGKP